MRGSGCRACRNIWGRGRRRKRRLRLWGSIPPISVSIAICRAAIPPAYPSIWYRSLRGTRWNGRVPGPISTRCFGRDGDAGEIYLYSAGTVDPAHSFYSRMFAPGMGIAEDPATGSAAAALAGALMEYEPLGDGTHHVVIEQGYAMGRPSLIRLQLIIEKRGARRRGNRWRCGARGTR